MAGNLTADGGNTYGYTSQGLLASSNGSTYVYGPEDERVRKATGGASTDYVYFGGQLLAIRNVSAGTWTDLIYGPTGLMAEVAGNQAATPIYRLTDHIGSIAQTTDNSGNQVDSVSFLPYGQTNSGSTSDPLRYTSLLFDGENGSYHADYRQHSPAQGRWLTPDPYSGSYQLTNPQSLNRYAYVSGPPFAYTDPSGLSMFGLIPPEAGLEGIWAEGIILASA